MINYKLDNTNYLLRQKIERLESGKEYQKQQRSIEKYSLQVYKLKDTIARRNAALDQQKRINHQLRLEKRHFQDLNEESQRELKAERKIRRIERKKHEQELEYARKRYLRAEKENSELKEQNAQYQEIIDKKDKTINKLQKVIGLLTSSCTADSTNSGKTTASDNERAREKRRKQKSRNTGNGRRKTDRKAGAQPGHKGHPRKPSSKAAVIETIDCPVPSAVAANPSAWKKTGVFKTHQVYNILLSVSAVNYLSSQWVNIQTGKKIYSPFPDEAVNEINYGPSIKAAAALLNNYCNVSVRKTSEFFSELSDGAIQLSAGFISQLKQEFSTKSKEDREKIFKALVRGPYLNADTTFTRVNGKLSYIHVSANKDNVLYQARKNKGNKAISGTPVEVYSGALVHDSEAVYWNYGGSHQTCLIHELRYCRRSIENEPDLHWAAEMERFFAEMIHQIHEKESFSPHEINELEIRFDQILEAGEKEYPDPKKLIWTEGRNTIRRLKKHKEAVFQCLHTPGLPFHNNHCEHLAREAKRKTRQCDQFRSDEGLRTYCDMQSVLQTAKMQHQTMHRKAIEVFSRPNQA